ncbi:MAG: hypothetical protein ACE5HD_05655 [Acidobacteriota bacterium]
MRKSLLLLLLLLAGCVAPSRSIRSNYADFNQTIQFNQGQQMLLNLVRMKYREMPLFLKVGALSTSYDLEASAAAHLGRNASTTAYGINVGSRYSARPTITYTPLEGSTFVKQVLGEVDSGTFVLLFRSGWPVKSLCHIMLERIGRSVNNADEPSYHDFKALVRRLQTAQDANALQVVTDQKEAFFEIMPRGTDESGPERSQAGGNSLALNTFQFRSFLDILFFLGKNTQVPPEQRDQVKAGQTNGWITIRSSREQPGDALVWVRHDGYYFSIARTDIRSKDTFALLKLIFQLQAGDIRTTEPLLTLPVVRP